jgi:hypothetical protein
MMFDKGNRYNDAQAQLDQRSRLYDPQAPYKKQGLYAQDDDMHGPFDVTQKEMWDFLEGHSPAGRYYERFTVILILLNVAAFVVGTLFDTTYNVNPVTGVYIGPNQPWMDVMFFGTESSLYAGLSVLEIFTVFIFTVDYFLRLWSCTEDKQYASRWAYVFSFYALVDFASIFPTYLNLCLPASDIAGTQFLRMFRLFRMMKMEGRYSEAFTSFDDVIASKKHVLLTAGFVGAVVWIIDAGFYYVAVNWSTAATLNMIYCPTCPDVDVAKCTLDAFGSVDCSKAGCPAGTSCSNLYESIPASMFQTVVNLFGEFPLTDRYQGWGMVVAGLTSVVASVVFGIPTGIIGSGFQEVLEKRKEREASERAPLPVGGGGPGYGAVPAAQSQTDVPARGSNTTRGRLYNFLFLHESNLALAFEYFIIVLIVLSTLTFMLQTCTFIETSTKLNAMCNMFECLTVAVFTGEYLMRAYSVGEDPKYAGLAGLRRYLLSFDALIDFFSIFPYYVGLLYSDNASLTMFIRSLRLIRVVKTGTFQSAFNVLRNVIVAQADILIITGFAALVFWIFFSSIMYYTERANPNVEMASYYNTIPNAMWITLLNLSGECPLVGYTTSGKVFICIIGLFAVGFISIPIGVLAAGFQDYVDENAETVEQVRASKDPATQLLSADAHPDHREHAALQAFLDAKTTAGRYFELAVLLLIFVSVGLAIIQTVPGHRCGADSGDKWCPTFGVLETLSVGVFTLEYLLRLLAAPRKFGFIFSFYSIVDLVAIIPYYIALCMPGGWFDKHNELFLMLRILRLVKLDSYCPSLSLIDDVFRLKRSALLVSGAIAAILLIIFNALMFLAEFNDSSDMIGTLPLYGCENCTEANRYSSAIASLPIVMIHLTGDYPIVQYNIYGRVVCFFMVVFAAGVVGIPTGIIADGFKEVVTKGGTPSALRAYDVKLAEIEAERRPPPREFDSPVLDGLQIRINALLNGTQNSQGVVKRSFLSSLLRWTILALILSNTVVILVETMPAVRKAAAHGNLMTYFNTFETIVVVFFTVEYVLRMFSVPKDKLHLYSRWCYATTFFGVVDLITIAPFYIQLALTPFGFVSTQSSQIFRLIRLFRLLELEHFVTAFTLLDNVFWRSRGTLLATGILAFCIWMAGAALFFMFEQGNPNWCTGWVEPACATAWKSTCVCAAPSAFDTMPHALFYTSIFLAGEWSLVDFTVGGKIVCMVLCIAGIALAALPVGILFDSFGAVLEDGLSALDEDDGDGKKDESQSGEPGPGAPRTVLGSWQPPVQLSWSRPLARVGDPEAGVGTLRRV